MEGSHYKPPNYIPFHAHPRGRFHPDTLRHIAPILTDSNLHLTPNNIIWNYYDVRLRPHRYGYLVHVHKDRSPWVLVISIISIILSGTASAPVWPHTRESPDQLWVSGTHPRTSLSPATMHAFVAGWHRHFHKSRMKTSIRGLTLQSVAHWMNS